MGWQVSIKEIKGETKYKIWSTITDSYITESWLTKKEVMNFFFWHRFRDFMYKFIEDAMTFPGGYSEKDTGMIIANSNSQEFYDFKLKSLKDDNVFYEKIYNELSELGITMNVSDGKHGINIESYDKI